MALSRAARQYLGVRAVLPPDLQTAERNPTANDKAYVKGTLWLNTDDATAFMWPGTGNWIALGSGTTGAIVSLTGDSGGAISPIAGNIDIVGGAGVTVVGTAGTLTISLTGGGLAIDSLKPDAGTDPVVPDANGLITMAGTANQITTTGGTNTLTFSLPSAITAPGSLTTTTSLAATTTVTAGTGVIATTGGVTATAGDITATAGNVIINGAAKQLRAHGGAVTDFIGQATLTNGTVTVANTNIATTDRIFVTRSAVNASSALGVFKVVKTASTNFVITACKPADGTTETGDASTVDYFIVRQV